MNELFAVSVAEAALSLHQSPTDWLVFVAERFAQAWNNPLGTIAQDYQQLEDGKIRLEAEIQRGPMGAPLSAVGLLSLSEQQRDLVYGQSAQCVSATDVFDGPLPSELANAWGLVGVRDVVGLFARDPDKRGVAVAVALPEPVRIAPRARVMWQQVAHQLGLAARLQRALRQTPIDARAHARFTPEGECLHAQGNAEAQGVRAHLRELVCALERAREHATEGQANEALSLWEALSRGEWILVDQFDADGERHIVAAPSPASASLRELSPQQEAIARAAGHGLSNKDIAAELGLTERSVDNQLRRALQKLGLPHRVALVRLWSTLERAGHTAG